MQLLKAFQEQERQNSLLIQAKVGVYCASFVRHSDGRYGSGFGGERVRAHVQTVGRATQAANGENAPSRISDLAQPVCDERQFVRLVLT